MSNGSISTSARDRLARADRVFLALGHPTRRHILFLLKLHGGEMTAGSIAERFSCRWPTVSRHLTALTRAGLVAVQRRGRERLYRLEESVLRGVAGGWLHWLESAGAAPPRERRRPETRRRRR